MQSPAAQSGNPLGPFLLRCGANAERIDDGDLAVCVTCNHYTIEGTSQRSAYKIRRQIAISLLTTDFPSATLRSIDTL